jgi:hypothetical protein
MLSVTLCALSAYAEEPEKTGATGTDREYWAGLCYRIASPVLENMSKGELVKNMEVEFSPTWDNRNSRVVYMEAFGRLMAGIAPWLALPEEDTPEGRQRKQLKTWALQAYKNAVDPANPDYLLWSGADQVLVDAAYLAQSFMRAPEATWNLLDKTTQERYIEAFKGLRTIRPAYNNWLLFRAMVETFIVWAGEKPDLFALTVALQKVEEWYLSDGWYSDGPEMALDYYNAFVIHPMYVEILETIEQKKIRTPISWKLALKRMHRFDQFMERLISPEGTFPAFGRSIVYRMGAFQTLALSAWRYGLAPGHTEGQVRSAITATMKRMFAVNGNFNKSGYLQLGFAGHQPHLSNYYTNNGSLYLTALVFLPLGLPDSDRFWTAPAEKWTSQKAWSGEAFPIDNHQSVKR